ncbi:MAG: hypothetical protein H7A24_05890 [Leptospiraceae bacterium]|nr:hypothetical protein [Leptospiraceae bacterium]MCP5511390.1 hypothetical protein [Leptospiraceae bacterium]
MKYFFPIFLLFFNLPILSQAEPPKEIQSLIDLNTLQNLEKKSSEKERGGDSVDEDLKTYTDVLKTYYSQFPEDRRTEEERSRAGVFLEDRGEKVKDRYRLLSGKVNSLSSLNEIRVFHRNLKSLPGPTSTIRNSETLYRIYSGMGRLYNQKKDIPHAISAYLSAFRFRDFSSEEASIWNEDYLSDHVDPSFKERALAHKKSYEILEKKKEEIKKFEDEFHLSQAQKARRGEAIEAEKPFQESLESKKKELEELEKSYETSHREVFLPLKREKSKIDSENLKDFALLLRSLEMEDRKLRALSSPYPLHDPDREKGLNGTTEILELANLIDPENASVSKLLGDDYRASSLQSRARDFYLLYLKAPEDRRDKSEEKEVFLSLAGLYSAEKNYLKSVEFYEKFVNSDNNSPTENEIYYFSLGDILARRLGDYERASNYLKKWLETQTKTDGTNSENQVETVRIEKKKMIVFLYLSRADKFKIRKEDELGNLLKSYDSFKKMKSIEKELEGEISQMSLNLDSIKKELLYQTESGRLEDYRKEKASLDRKLSIMEKIRTEIRTLPVSDVLFRLTEIYEIDRDLEKTLSLFREIQEFGSEVEKVTALKNIRRLEMIRKDGIYREIIRN